jgi:polysaccharide export outer membrane protein
LSFRKSVWAFAALLLISLTAVGVQGAPRERLVSAFLQSTQSASGSPRAADKSAKDKGENQLSEKSTKPDPAVQSALTPEQRLTYIIGVEDELQISVWREPELSASVVVRPDGMITLALVNDVKAAGLKPEELQTLLTDKLKGFINDPQVTVIVRSIRSRKVNLVGEVARQGTFPLNGDMTVLELLAAAGGLGPYAKGDSIYILREVNGKKVRIPFRYKKALAGKEENVVLHPGDLIVVP